MTFKTRGRGGVLLALLILLWGPASALADKTAPDLPASVSAPETGLRQKIGQMIVVGFQGNTPERKGFRKVLAQMERGEIGGVLFLGRNLKDRKTVRAMTAALSEAAPSILPPLIAIDQEGGVVQRLRRRHGFPQTPSARAIARRSSPSEAGETYDRLAAGLADWGFTLNLGPVVDVDVNRRNPIIGRLERSYSSDPDKVADYGAAFVAAHRQNGVLTALKHFPGHGSSRHDTHKGAVDVTRTWSDAELDPFRQLIETDMVDLIMTAHVVNRSLGKDRGRLPVSLSQSVLQSVLREDLDYSGVIISDDLQMDAIRQRFSLEDTVLKAVGAGTDILLFANDKRPDPEIPGKVAAILLEAASTDPALRQKIEAAFARIQGLKSRLASGEAEPADVIEARLRDVRTDPERCSLTSVQ